MIIVLCFVSLVHSWWPWRSSSDEGTCILRTQDGWLKKPCNEYHPFICERDINRQSIPLTIRCGDAPLPLAPIRTKITTSTTTASTTTTKESTTKIFIRQPRPTVAFVQPPVVTKEILASNSEENFFDPPIIPTYEELVTPKVIPEQKDLDNDKKSSMVDPSKIMHLILINS